MNKKVTYKQLMKLFREFRSQQILLLSICLISLFLNIFFIYQIQGIVDCVINQSDLKIFVRLLQKILILGILTLGMNVIQNTCWSNFRNLLINKMRVLLYQGMVKKNVEFFDTHTTGDIVSAIMNDGSIIAQSAGISILMFIVNLVHIGAILFLMIRMNVTFGFMILGVSTVYYFFMTYVNGKMRTAFREQQKGVAGLTQSLSEKIRAEYDIIVLDKQQYFAEKFEHQVMREFFEKVKKVIFVEVLNGALSNVMKIIFPIMTVAAGAFLVYQGKLSIGMIVAAFTLVQNLIEPLNNMGDLYQGQQQALGSAERVYDYLFEENQPDGELTLSGNIDEMSIQIDSYSWGNKEILKNLSQKAVVGDFIFVSGESGCGKTTLLKLICGLYQVKHGGIFADKTDIKDISRHSYYDNVQMLFQDPFLFEGTIEENLTLGETYGRSEIEEILKIVYMDDFVREHGLDYRLAEGGHNVSGGQRQRLCLARILLRRPKVLLLDEATSAVGKEMEGKILGGLRQFMEKNPMMIIAVSHSKEYEKYCTQMWRL